jgi:hypothetical protein
MSTQAGSCRFTGAGGRSARTGRAQWQWSLVFHGALAAPVDARHNSRTIAKSCRVLSDPLMELWMKTTPSQKIVVRPTVTMSKVRRCSERSCAADSAGQGASQGLVSGARLIAVISTQPDVSAGLASGAARRSTSAIPGLRAVVFADPPCLPALRRGRRDLRPNGLRWVQDRQGEADPGDRLLVDY